MLILVAVGLQIRLSGGPPLTPPIGGELGDER